MEHVWCEEEAIGLLEDLLEALPAGAAKAEALPPLSMGTLVLVAEGLCAPDQQQQQRKCIIDGEQRILALCLILAASRACLLESSSAAGFEAAKQIRLMLVQGGNLMEGLPEQLRVQLGTKDDTAFLRRLLVEPTCQPGSAELSGDMQPRLWTCLQLYRRRLAKLGLRRLQLLVRFIQARVCVTVFRLPSPEALSLLLVCAWLPDLLRLNWLLETGYLPEGGYKLAASADIVISLGGRLLPLHRAVLSAGSGVLRQALEADDSTDGRAAAVQDALQGEPLPGVQLFLRLLYSGSAGAAEDMEDPWALASAAALAHSLDASGVLKACDARLCCLLDPTADWPAWLVLADRYGLRQLRCIAAERVLTDLVKHCSKEERRQMLQKLGGLGAGTYGLLFETTLETAASYRVELTHWKDKGLPINTGSLP